MIPNPVVLMVTAQASNFDAFRRTLKESAPLCDLRRAADPSVALTRVAGGGVQAILYDISERDWAKVEGVRKFRASTPRLPFILWSDVQNSTIAALASQTGASGWLTPGSSAQEAARLMTFLPELVERGPAQVVLSEVAPVVSPGHATIISVMGVKGGVGTTIVAMNLASALTRRGSVILAEIRPMFGSLQTYFHPGRMVRSLSAQAEAATFRPDSLPSLLWPVPDAGDLRVLFGPTVSQDCVEMDRATVSAVLRALSCEADFVVIDLPQSFSPANREILGASHHLAVVLEPSEHCLKLGHLMLEGIRSWDKTPVSIGAVAVRRNPDGQPLSQSEIEAALVVPLLGSIPPAPQLCFQGERQRVPLFQCDPESLVADSFSTLSRRFAAQSRSTGPKALT